MRQETETIFDVVIVGGGLAGCSAAIVLAQRGFRVIVLEKDRFPRDKLCGEFLSTEVADLCSRLGVLDSLKAAGARSIRRLLVTSSSGQTFETTLPGTALGVSRRTLDAAFFDRAREVGAEMREMCLVRNIDGLSDQARTVSFDGGRVRGRTVLGAYGRRETLDRRLGRAFLQDTSPYVAFKAHFTGLDLSDVIELHAFPAGYCGLLTEDHGAANACFICHERALKAVGGSPEAMIDAAFRANGHLSRRFQSLRQISEFYAASQLLFRPKTLFDQNVCMIGDTAGMIAPLCGDGMAMAIQTGEMAAAALGPFLEGRATFLEFRAAYKREWVERYAARMRLGGLLHTAFVRPRISGFGIRAARLLPFAARAVIRATRG